LEQRGFTVLGSVEDVALDEARQQFEVNLFGLAAVTQAVVPHMRRAKQGLIINTSSVGGKVYFPMGAWYHASKHAVEGLSDCLRLELKPFGIDVVVLEPGFFVPVWESIAPQFREAAKDSAYASLRTRLSRTPRKPRPRQHHSTRGKAKAVSQIISARKPEPVTGSKCRLP
jgi:NAD(P)-dependent dehydrogenase (short-subunit alcohol dehydrogenase family)